jgi:hypothetical protein
MLRTLSNGQAIMTHSFDITNPQVRQVITPDGIGSLIFADAGNPNYFFVQVKIGDKKIADIKRYAVEELQEVEK